MNWKILSTEQQNLLLLFNLQIRLLKRWKNDKPMSAIFAPSINDWITLGNLITCISFILDRLEFDCRESYKKIPYNKIFYILSVSNWNYWPPTLEYSSANSSSYDQYMTPRHILLEPKSRTAYCYIHKVASSTWMSFFTHLHKEEKRFKALIHFGKYYR